MGNIRFILHFPCNANIRVESADHWLFRPSDNFLQMTKDFECFAKMFRVFDEFICCRPLSYFKLLQVDKTIAVSRFVFLRSARLCCLYRTLLPKRY